jgi:hypothetical protein
MTHTEEVTKDMAKKQKTKKFKVKKKMSRFGKCVRFIVRRVKRRARVINLNDHEIPTKSVLIGNHNGAGGPFNLRTSMETHFMTWGAHQMTEGFRSRWKYLYNVFYRQKLGYGKLRSFLCACGFGLISPIPYTIAGTIPVYFDTRVRRTFEYSVQCIEEDVPVLLFPENSNDGYKTQIEEFWPGFLLLVKHYYRKHGVDLPIYTLRFNPKPKTITIGKPMYYQELAKKHNDTEILEIFRKYMNDLTPESHKDDLIPSAIGNNSQDGQDTKKEETASE